MKNALGIHSPSKVMRDQVGKNIALGVIAGVDSKKKNAKKSAKQLASVYVEAAKSKATSMKKANKLSEAQEIQYWSTIVKHVKKGTKAYTQAKNNLNDSKNKLSKDVASATKTYVKDVAKVKEELNKSISDLKKTYNDSVQKRKEEIMNSLNLFDGVKFDKKINKANLTKNLKSQVAALRDWDNTLDSLRKRIGNSALLEELEGQGVTSLNTLKSINSMSDKELKEYVSLYNQKNAIALERSKTENKALLAETNKQIATLKVNAQKQINTLTSTYVKELKSLGVSANGQSKEIGKQITNGIGSGMSTGMKGLSKTMKGQIETLVKGVKKQLKIKSPSRVFRDEVGQYMALGIGVGFENSLSSVYRQMQTAVDFETQKLSANLSTTATVGKVLNANITMESSDVYLDRKKVGRMVTPSVSKTLRAGGAYEW